MLSELLAKSECHSFPFDFSFVFSTSALRASGSVSARQNISMSALERGQEEARKRQRKTR